MPTSGAAIIWLIFAAYVIAILTTVVGQHNTTGWHHAVRRFHIFEALLVVVGILQWFVLSRTDEALHLAAQAQNTSAHLLETTERAWIGPRNTHTTPPVIGGPITVDIYFDNTGRLPASYRYGALAQFVSQADWNSGTVNTQLIAMIRESCVNNLPNVVNPLESVAFPTTGLTAFYTLNYVSNSPQLTENTRFVVTDQNNRNHDVFIYLGCFVYEIIGESEAQNPLRHSFFCYYEQLPSTQDHLNYRIFRGSQYAD